MTRNLIALALLASLAAGGADAQERKKLYRWVDKDGKVQFSDSLPPEAVDQARTEINAESGRATAEVDRALTAEERAARERELAEIARREEEEETRRRSEEAMIASFQTEDELRRSFGARVELLKQTVQAIEAGIGGQRTSLASLLVAASEAELAGRAVTPKEAKAITDLHREMGRQQQMLIVREAELRQLDRDLERMVERFRELKQLEADAASAGSTPPPG